MTGLPNTFQIFNDYVDRAMMLVTDSELRCLIFATRHILGWQDKIAKRQGKISLNMFENGFTDKNGKHYCGCGLGRHTIVTALKGLVEYRLLEKVGELTNDGQEYSLQTDVDWDGLNKRYQEWQEAKNKRIQKARSCRKGGLSDNTTGLLDNTSVVGQTPSGLSDNTTGGLLDNTQTNPCSNPSSNPIEDTPAPIGAVIPTQPTKVADLKTKTPAVKAVKAKIPSYPRSVNSWEWCHLERFASENPNVNALAALPDSMRKCLKELSTAIVARHCVTLYQELQRNKVTAERYSSLYQVGKDRAKADEKWDIFQHMLWALPKWLDGNGSQPTITLIDDPTPVKPRSMEELRALAAEMRREKAAS